MAYLNKRYKTAELKKKMCLPAISAARRLFKDGDMDEAEYDKIIRECDQEIEVWNQMTGEQEQVEYELKMCVESLSS